MRLRRWESKLRVIDDGVFTDAAPVWRPATFWEKVRWMLGMSYKGPARREVRKP